MESLLKQSYENIEIVIINDNSTDETESYIKSLKNDKIKYFSIKNQIGLARLRNCGIKNSSGKYIFFTDSDCIATKNWIQEGINIFKEKKFLAIEGKTIAEHQNYGLSDHIVENYLGGTYQTCNIAYEKNALLELNMFDKRYSLAYEDIDLALRFKEKYEIFFSKDMLVLHQIVPWTFLGLIKNAQRAKYKVMLLKNHKDHNILKYKILEINSLIQVIFPFLMLFYFRIQKPRDILFLPLLYIRAVVHRIIIWKSSIIEKILIF